MSFTQSMYIQYNNKHGIYFLFDKDEEIIYVGSTGNLATRLITHRLNSIIDTDLKYDLMNTAGVAYNHSERIENVRIVEQYIIDKLKPIGNIAVFNFRNWYSSLPVKPERTLSEYEEIGDNIIKNMKPSIAMVKFCKSKSINNIEVTFEDLV